MGAEADLVKPRFARGCRCFAVILDGSIAGYGWLSTQPEWIGELQLEICPRKGEGYIWNCVTLQQHRRKGIFGSLLVGISEAARHVGVKRLWLGSVAIPAEKSLGRLGFRQAVRFRSVTVGGLHLMRVSVAGSELRRDGLHVLSTRPGLRVGTFRRHRH